MGPVCAPTSFVVLLAGRISVLEELGRLELEVDLRSAGEDLAEVDLNAIRPSALGAVGGLGREHDLGMPPAGHLVFELTLPTNIVVSRHSRLLRIRNSCRVTYSAVKRMLVQTSGKYTTLLQKTPSVNTSTLCLHIAIFMHRGNVWYDKNTNCIFRVVIIIR